MNSRERMALAMKHKIPDRVPVMCQLTLGHYFLNMRDKWKPHEIWFSSAGFADALVTVCRRYRFDGILINIPGRHPNWRDDIVSVTEEADGESLMMTDGTHVFVPWDDNAQYEPLDMGKNPRPDFLSFDPDSDFRRINTWQRYVWGAYHVHHLPEVGPELMIEPPDYFYSTIDLVREQVGDEISVHGEVFSPFTHFMELFGYQNALVALLTDEGRAKAVLDRMCDTVIGLARGQADRGVDAVLISSAFVGGGFISPQMYSEFVVPYERKVTDALHESHPHVPIYTHSCGKLDDRLELLAATGTDGIDTLDPPPLGNIELANAKVRIGEQLFIKGNMDSVALLDDTDDSLNERALSAISNGMANGGYILSTACSVAPRVEPWKLSKLVEIAEEHGTY